MSLDTLLPPLTPTSATDKPEIKVLQAEFGDGYTQGTRDGLNNTRRVLSLKWDVLTIAQATSLIGFFAAKGGCDPFLYLVPSETTPVQWTCKDYQQGFATANYRSVTATLRQDFSLAS